MRTQCKLTNHIVFERCHIIPRRLKKYGFSELFIENYNNILPFNRNFHYLFDSYWVTFDVRNFSFDGNNILIPLKWHYMIEKSPELLKLCEMGSTKNLEVSIFSLPYLYVHYQFFQKYYWDHVNCENQLNCKNIKRCFDGKNYLQFYEKIVNEGSDPFFNFLIQTCEYGHERDKSNYELRGRTVSEIANLIEDYLRKNPNGIPEYYDHRK